MVVWVWVWVWVRFNYFISTDPWSVPPQCEIFLGQEDCDFFQHNILSLIYIAQYFSSDKPKIENQIKNQNKNRFMHKFSNSTNFTAVENQKSKIKH
jgi:hypothetical protein